MKRIGIIYKITNLKNGAIYIGKVLEKKGIELRFKEHLNKPFNESTKNKKTFLSNAIKKYGKENFKIEEIDEAFTIEEMNEKEKFWIKKTEAFTNINNYNMTEGGDGGCYGYKHTEESKKKISENNKKRIMTDELREKFSLAQKKRILEGKAENCGRKKIKVCMLNIETEEEIKWFNSIAEAAKFISNKNAEVGIRRVLKGKQNTAYGYKWKKE